MGSCHSYDSDAPLPVDVTCKSNSTICNCFHHDQYVQQTTVVRHVSSKWIWTKYHDLILNESLTNIDHEFPLLVVALIKDHAFSAQSDHYVSKTTLCKEKYYEQSRQLLHKTLCTKWYHRYFMQNHPFRWFTMALFDKHGATSRHIINYFADNCFYLPALRLKTEDPKDTATMSDASVKRTLHIDECSVSINLLNHSNDPCSVQLNLFVLDENNEIKDVNSAIRRMNTNHTAAQSYLLVRVNHNSKQTLSKEQICRNYNMSCFDVSLNSEESMHNLFVFAIKYHWFCMVQSVKP
eukprot:111934_1